MNTRLITISFLFLFVVLAHAKQTTSLSDIQAFLSGEPTREQVMGYVKELEEIIKYDPEECRNYEMLALCYDHLGQHAKAAEMMRQEIKYFPEGEKGLDSLYGNLAGQYLYLKKYEDAKHALDKALEINPKNTMTHRHLFDYYLLTGKYQEAAVQLKTISELDSNEDYYYDAYFAALRLDVSLENAIVLFREAVKINPDSHLAHRALATALRGVALEDIERKFPLVMEELNKAWELNPKYIPTYISIADLYMFMGIKTGEKRYFKDALAWFLKARKLDPKNYRIGYAIGHLFVNSGQYEKAIVELENVAKNVNSNDSVAEMLVRAYNGKAYNSYKSGKKLKEGLRIIDKALNIRPNDGMLLSTKAELLFKLGRLNEAYDYIKKAIVLNPDEAEIKQDLESIEKAIRNINKKE